MGELCSQLAVDWLRSRLVGGVVDAAVNFERAGLAEADVTDIAGVGFFSCTYAHVCVI